jgi:hypothetical protein
MQRFFYLPFKFKISLIFIFPNPNTTKIKNTSREFSSYGNITFIVKKDCDRSFNSEEIDLFEGKINFYSTVTDLARLRGLSIGRLRV